MKSNTFKYLIICLSIGCIATDCAEEELDPNYKININVWFEIEPETGPINSTFTYIIDPGVWGYADDKELNNDVEEFQWDFDYTGEGVYSFDTEVISEKTITHVYSVPGTYTVILKATVEDAVKYSERELIVTESTNTSPVAVFTIDPESGNTLTEFIFNASGCSDDVTPVDELEVAWDFDNDGGWDSYYSTDKIVTHQYALEGEYEVRMNVKDGDGNVSELIKGLTIENCNEGGEPCPGAAFVMIDGDQYNTVQIGNQCWLNSNLNIGTYIESVNNQSNQTNNGEIEKFCYENTTSFCDTYGGLYQWNEMMNYSTQSNMGICPDEWHIPSLADWNELVDYLGGEYEANNKLKSCTEDWKYSAFAVNSNESGFTGLPGGFRHYYNEFGGTTEIGAFWTSTLGQYTDRAEIIYLSYMGEIMINNSELWHNTGASVRCIKN